MRWISISAPVGAALLCAGGPAVAQNMFSAPSSFAPPPAAIGSYPAAPYPWTGAYIGAQAGYSWSSTTASDSNTLTGASLGGGSANTSTPSGGLRIGYDHLMSSGLVWGVSAGLSLVDSKTSSTSTTVNGFGTFIQNTNTKTDVSGNVLGRLGYAFGRAMVYGTGGWAWDSGSATRTQVAGTVGQAIPGTSETASIFRNGWTAGGGLELALTDRMSAFAEHRHTEFGAIETTYPLAHISSRATTDSDNITTGANWRF